MIPPGDKGIKGVFKLWVLYSGDLILIIHLASMGVYDFDLTLSFNMVRK
jgi:hypothetical protein